MNAWTGNARIRAGGRPADFKGQFHTRDGIYCFPLTIADRHTRYLLRVHGLLNTRGAGVRPVFERAFREYGLPRAIRTDNGVPFANTGLHGLTQLNVWWLRLGIWSLYLGAVLLGKIDEAAMKIFGWLPTPTAVSTILPE
jgi:hypothetical protein